MTSLLSKVLGCSGKQIACVYVFYLFEHVLFENLSEARIAIVIVNAHVFDVLIHLRKLSFKYLVELKKKKKHLNQAFV